jgi:cyclopropane fatty-acyl-phospholipid synthase-like methyltransferase
MKIQLPFVPTPEQKVEKMLKWASVKPGQKCVDLGAGDGRVVIAFAKAGANAFGFEIQQKYARRAKANIIIEGLQGKAKVSEADFWEEDLSDFEIVTIYGMTEIMERISKKLILELKPGTVVISNGFPIPNWKELKQEEHLYYYIRK